MDALGWDTFVNMVACVMILTILSVQLVDLKANRDTMQPLACWSQ